MTHCEWGRQASTEELVARLGRTQWLSVADAGRCETVVPCASYVSGSGWQSCLPICERGSAKQQLRPPGYADLSLPQAYPFPRPGVLLLVACTCWTYLRHPLSENHSSCTHKPESFWTVIVTPKVRAHSHLASVVAHASTGHAPHIQAPARQLHVHSPRPCACRVLLSSPIAYPATARRYRAMLAVPYVRCCSWYDWVTVDRGAQTKGKWAAAHPNSTLSECLLHWRSIFAGVHQQALERK